MPEFDDNTIMTFGKHAGEKLANVPADYLISLYEKGLDKRPALKKYIEDNMEILKSE